jgi:hypothetical protein
MDSNLHMHVASLQIQDRIAQASAQRQAKQAERASAAPAPTVARRGHWVALRRLVTPSLRRAH